MQDEQRKNADVAIPFGKLPRRERCSVRPPSSLSSTSRHDIGPPAKRKKEDLGSKGPSRLMPSSVKKPSKKNCLKDHFNGLYFKHNSWLKSSLIDA